MRRMAIGVAVAVLVMGCAGSTPRMAVYKAPRDRFEATLVEVLRGLGDPFSGPAVHTHHSDFTVGPLLFGPNQQRITGLVSSIPEGSYRVTLYIGAVSSRFDERYLDIRVAVFRLEEGAWKLRPISGGQRRGGHHADTFQNDSWLASIVDPIYNAMFARLESE
jgi:hypothetical protein